MTLIKKFAWYGSSVAFAAVLALALVVTGPARTAEAATMTTLAYPLTGALVGTTQTISSTTTIVTFTTLTDIPADGAETRNKIEITFPAGTTFTNGAVVGNWSVTVGGTAVTLTAATNATANIISLDTAGQIAVGAVVVSGTGTLAIVHDGTKTTTGTVTVQTRDSGTAADEADGTAVDNQTISNVVLKEGLKAVQTSAPADGLSTAVVNFNSNDAAGDYTNGATLTFTTSAGTFSASSGTSATVAAPAIAVDKKSATAVAANAAGASTISTLTLTSSTTVETATVRVYQTPAGGGTAVLKDTITVSFKLAAGASASGTITTPTTAISIASSSTQSVVATFKDANGSAPTPGESVTATTSLGTLTSSTLTCAGQSCTGTLATGGTATVVLTGGNVAGTGTVTFTRGAVVVTAPFIFTGAANTIVASHSGTATVKVDISRSAAQTTTFNYATRDAAGALIANTPTVTAAGANGAGCSATGTVTAGLTTTASGTVAFTSVANQSPAGTVCTYTLTAATGKTTTVSYTLRNAAGATSVITITTPATCALNTTCTISGTVHDADGNPVADGTTVTLVASVGAMVTSGALNVVGGAFTGTYLAPGTDQNVTVAASSSTTSVPTVSAVFGVGGAVPTTPTGDGRLTAPSFGTGNVGAAVFAGGTVEQLSAQVAASGGTSVWAQSADGSWVRYNTLATGATAFVNNAFNAAFAAGFTGPTAVFVVK